MLYGTALCKGPIQNGIIVAVGRVGIVGAGWAGLNPQFMSTDAHF